jgi:hypothetical protein
MSDVNFTSESGMPGHTLALRGIYSMKSGVMALFGLTALLAALLLFSVQPLIGKMAVPVVGGTPAVWNTCLVYFQSVLLCGYLVTHGVGFAGGNERWRVSTTFLVVLAALLAWGYSVQPIGIQASTGGWNQALSSRALVLLAVLGKSATLPLVLVSATAPLLQCWFALTDHPRARDPYFLYAASNSGSLLALLAYPLVIEPNLGVNAQTEIWRRGFLVLAILVLACGVIARRQCWSRGVRDGAHEHEPSPEPRGGSGELDRGTILDAGILLKWLALVFIPSSWLLGVTTYLTTDMASIPLFWVIPLSVYLLSFVIAFSRVGARAASAARRLLPYLVMPLVLLMSSGMGHMVWIVLHVLTFFVGAVACHGALAQSRPGAQRVGAYYVVIATGGLLGGIWTALLAPLVFDRVAEYPLAVVLGCLITLGSQARHEGRAVKEWVGDLLFGGVVFLLVLILATNQLGLAESVLGVIGVMVASGLGILACVRARGRPIRFVATVASILAASSFARGPNGRLLHVERNFFGVIRVTSDDERNAHRLFHGSTLHGQQSLAAKLRCEPSTYYTRSGPMGQLFEVLAPRLVEPGAPVGIVGLGVGTLASYSQSGQRWTFYEIDPAMERIARERRFFTYLADCPEGMVGVILGDARLRLQDAPNHAYRLIVLDAFSSDVVPVHLLTIEAIRLYRAKLAQGGVLALHLTNRYLDLEPVVGRQAESEGLICRIRYDLHVSAAEKRAGKHPSIWAVMAESGHDLGDLMVDARWCSPALRKGSPAWTDDYSDLASYLILTPGQRWQRESRHWPRKQRPL